MTTGNASAVRRLALGEKLFETDYKCEDNGCDSGYCEHCSESAFEKCNGEEMSEMSSKEYPVWVKKRNQGKEGGKLPPPATKLKWQIQLVDEDVSAVLLALKKETSLQTITQSSHF